MRGHSGGPRLPSFRPVRRLRPVALVRPGTDLTGLPTTAPTGGAVPGVAVERDLDAGSRTGEASLSAGGTTLRATYDGARVAVVVDDGGHSSQHVSRRHGRAHTPDALALTLTGPVATGWAREDGCWRVRAVVDLSLPDLPHAPDVHDESWLRELTADGDRAGRFGQLGLRDLRMVSHADGTPYRHAGRLALTATSAGPGGFRTAHTSVWLLDPDELTLEHRADLYFRRPEGSAGVPRVYGDHATHLVREDGRWLVATSTWGDFDKARNPHVTTTLATSTRDLLAGLHVLDTVWLDLPTELPARRLTSVGRWDPHLVRTAEGWLVAFVTARRYFSFHPALAAGPDLAHLTLRAAATDRVATEGPTVVRLDDDWWVLASDGRAGRRGRRALPAGYPVLDLDLRDRGRLDAAYPTNLPWPTVAPHADGWLLVGFDGTAYGGPLAGYGTHGDVVLQRSLPDRPPSRPSVDRRRHSRGWAAWRAPGPAGRDSGSLRDANDSRPRGHSTP